MPRYISPLDDMFIRFDAAASLMAHRDHTVTADGALELLVRAMWHGRFEPCDFDKEPRTRKNDRDDPENWLSIPIAAPGQLLTPEQATLRPRPREYYSAGRSTIISVMYTEGLLPGAYEQWKSTFSPESGLPLNLDTTFDALIRTPLAKYPQAGKDYFNGLYVPRRILQAWLERRSSKFTDLFAACAPALDASPPTAKSISEDGPAPIKGRPRFPSQELVRERAIALKLAHPDMTHKIIAYKARQSALEKFDKADVWTETTIYSKLGSYFKDLPDSKTKPH